ADPGLPAGVEESRAAHQEDQQRPCLRSDHLARLGAAPHDRRAAGALRRPGAAHRVASDRFGQAHARGSARGAKGAARGGEEGKGEGAMIASSLQPVVNHLWQSTLFAAAAGVAALALRRHRAQTRYAVWLAASVKFLIPFSILVDWGSRLGWHRAVEPGLQAVEPASLSFVMMEPAGRAVAAALPSLPAAPASPSFDWIPAAAAVVWAAGCIILTACWWRRWRALRAVLRMATPVDLPIGMEARMSPAFGEPGVFGIFRPVLLLPEDLAGQLTPAQFEAIVRHEQCHVRRRDNLATAIHMVVEAVFWF